MYFCRYDDQQYNMVIFKPTFSGLHLYWNIFLDKSLLLCFQVGAVKYKKYEGVLFVMSERIGWMPGSKSNFSVTHKYTEIKSQKISPEGKSKIQLQIVLHDGNSTTFHFVNPSGLSAQCEDRDRVKEKLVELLPKFKRKINKELEEKNKTLSDNPALLQLYKDLVMLWITWVVC